MDRKTLRTLIGYCATLIRNKTGIGLRANRPDAVYNYRSITERLCTSGQPTKGQLEAIRDAGFRRVINLAPSGAENALPDEAAILSALNVEYIHIPVDFANPNDADFERFVEVMQNNGDTPIWVHCAANARVSAFVYRYRRDVLKDDETAAREDLQTIWDPKGAWREFVGWP